MDRKQRELGKDGKATAEAVSAGVSLPADNTGKPDKASRPSKIAELFRQGEDLYGMGLYQQAIHVWTRILFLERGDTRAKRAIERAKRAVSERQRELDVELAEAAKILDAGNVEAAAKHVRRVLTVDPRHAEGHQLAERIAARKRRDEPAPAIPAVAEEAHPHLVSSKRGLLLRVSRTPSTTLSRSARSSSFEMGLKMTGFALAVILVFASGALYLHLNWESIVSDGAFVTGSALAPAGVEPVDASVPGASELHYYNGARLYAKGRYRQALAELSLVGRDEVVSERARSLILRIEERLLRGGELDDSELATAEAVR